MPKFSDIIGTYQVHPLEAVQMLQAIFEPQDLISLSGKRAGVSRTTVLTQMIKQEDLVEELMSERGEETLHNLCFEPHEMDLYVGLGAVKKDKQFQPFNRVKEKDIASVRCLYLDVDVKDGAFESTQEAWDFVWETCIKYNTPPTFITASGSGGLHVYWRLTKQPLTGLPRSEIEVPQELGKDLLKMWWTLFNSEAEVKNRYLDQLTDTSRMSRIAGSIHFPKTFDGKLGEVRELYYNPRNEYNCDYISSIAAETYHNYNDKVKIKRAQELKDARKMKVKIEAPPENASMFERIVFLANQADYYPEWVNEHMRWDDILIPHGWTFLTEGTEGRRNFARPNQTGKSCVVDWEGSEGNVMSLMSTSRETGLLDLLEAQIPLTKWRVLVRLSFNDDYDAAMKWVDEQNGR